MAENEKNKTEKHDGVEGEAPAGRPGKVEVSPVCRSNEQGEASGPADSRQHGQDDARSFLRRLTTNERLTLLVGVGSLAISVLTYQNATDTSDLKAAVGNLTNLASESKRQADAMHAQAKAVQGQLDQMTADQRPWLMANELSVEGIDILPDDAIIMFSTNYKITNFGRSPAIGVFVTTALFIQGIDTVNEEAIRKLCQPRPAGGDLFLHFHRDIIGPGQNESIIGFPFQSGIFVRDTRSLEKAGIFKVNADFVLGGCVTYKFLGSDTLRTSGFTIRAQGNRHGFLDPGFGLEFDQVQIVKKEKVKLRSLMLTPVGIGTFAD